MHILLFVGANIAKKPETAKGNSKFLNIKQKKHDFGVKNAKYPENQKGGGARKCMGAKVMGWRKTSSAA